MLFKVIPALFARLLRPRPRAGRAQEPADMGTAFGMEQWLDERDQPATPARRASSARHGVRWLQLGAARQLRS